MKTQKRNYGIHDSLFYGVNRECKLGMRVQTQAFALKNNHKCHACNSRFTIRDWFCKMASTNQCSLLAICRPLYEKPHFS